MDLVTALATIVQLLGLFRQEQGQREDLTHRQFMEWLEYHRHEELKNVIAQTFHLSQEVDRLLCEDQQTILAKLNNINSMVADILRHVEGFGALTATLAPEAGLSDDAVATIRMFSQSGARTLVLFPDDSGVMFAEVQQAAQYDDTRFIADDLDSLVSHGLLKELYGSSTRAFNLTRRGAAFVNMLAKEPNEVA
jgi:hypothetical protein